MAIQVNVSDKVVATREDKTKAIIESNQFVAKTETPTQVNVADTYVVQPGYKAVITDYVLPESLTQGLFVDVAALRTDLLGEIGNREVAILDNTSYINDTANQLQTLTTLTGSAVQNVDLEATVLAYDFANSTIQGNMVIGYERNPNGTYKLDANDELIPIYGTSATFQEIHDKTVEVENSNAGFTEDLQIHVTNTSALATRTTTLEASAKGIEASLISTDGVSAGTPVYWDGIADVMVGNLYDFGDERGVVQYLGGILGDNSDGWVVYSATVHSMLDAVSQSVSDLDDAVAQDIAAAVSGMQDQIDGVIDTWFADELPTLLIEPALTWVNTDTTNGNTVEQDKHLGDLFYNNDTGAAYRFSYIDPDYEWVIITDEAISAALLAASNAQDTADGKRRVFVTQPTAAGIDTDGNWYNKGDLWVLEADGVITNGLKGDMYRSTENRDSYLEDDWVEASSYQSAVDALNLNLQSQLDGKIETYYQDDMPYTDITVAQEEQDANGGDLWYCTDEANTTYDAGKVYEYTETVIAGTPDTYTYAWTETTGFSNSLFDLADGKRTLYGNVSDNVPTGVTNDIWIPTTGTDDATYIPSEIYQYNGSAWILATKYTDDTAVETFINGEYDAFKTNISTSVDKKAETFYQSSTPTSRVTAINEPDNEGLNEYIGDMWFETDTNKSYIYTKTANGSNWDYDWTEHAIPNNVFDAVDGKAAVYLSDNKPTEYNSRDIIIVENNNDIGTFSAGVVLTCKTSGQSVANIFTDADWEKKANDTEELDSYKTIADTKINLLEVVRDGNIDAYYQNSAPTTGLSQYDWWINTSNTPPVVAKRYEDETWVDRSSTAQGIAYLKAAESKSTADGKIATFIDIEANIPTAEGVGDLWIITDDNNKVKRWDGLEWADIDKVDKRIEPGLKADIGSAFGGAPRKYDLYRATDEYYGYTGDIDPQINKLYEYDGTAWVVLSLDDTTAIDGWTGGAHKLLHGPDGSVTGWSFGDGSDAQGEFKIRADKFQLSSSSAGVGDVPATPFTVQERFQNDDGVTPYNPRQWESIFQGKVTFGNSTIDTTDQTQTVIDGESIQSGTIKSNAKTTNERNSITEFDLNNGVLKVFDLNGNLRVQLGDLT